MQGFQDVGSTSTPSRAAAPEATDAAEGCLARTNTSVLASRRPCFLGRLFLVLFPWPGFSGPVSLAPFLWPRFPGPGFPDPVSLAPFPWLRFLRPVPRWALGSEIKWLPIPPNLGCWLGLQSGNIGNAGCACLPMGHILLHKTAHCRSDGGSRRGRGCSSGVEHHVANVRVVGSNPIARSNV